MEHFAHLLKNDSQNLKSGDFMQSMESGSWSMDHGDRAVKTGPVRRGGFDLDL